jgi:dTDP-4-amino-4,6-dideoxygalactose transaminase
MYYFLVESIEVRTSFLRYLKDKGILVVFHYIPLHSSPAGRRYGRFHGNLSVADFVSDRILRLPLHVAMDSKYVQYLADLARNFFLNIGSKEKKILCRIT